MWSVEWHKTGDDPDAMEGPLKRFIYLFLPTILGNIYGKSNDDVRERRCMYRCKHKKPATATSCADGTLERQTASSYLMGCGLPRIM